MNTVFIIPTGLGCKIGGHAGDATPAFKLIASISDIAICNPNVVNASDINEMPDNTWYVEGSILDRFLEGKIYLEKPKSNKILLVVNKPIRPETINAVNAARFTIGCEIEIIELEERFSMIAQFNKNGTAGGTCQGIDSLIRQVKRYNFDTLALATNIYLNKKTALNYFREGGINPWGGIEAIVSKKIATIINKPVAHAPVENNDPDLKYFNEVVPARESAEVLSMAFIHCVFKGLHKAPRISDKGLYVTDIDFLISPSNCYGRPHKACEQANIPIITVKENSTCLKGKFPEFEWVDNYFEAAGYIQSLNAGIRNSTAISKLF